MNYKKVGVITLAITLIAIGGLFLVNNFVDLQLSMLFSILWPSIIVLLGLELIISKLILERKEEKHKIKISGGSIFLLIILIIGLSLFSNINISSGFNFISLDFNRGIHFFPINSKYESEFKENLTIETEGRNQLFIENAFGDVTVDRGEGENIIVDANIAIKHNDEEYAKEVSDEILEVLKNQSDIIKLRSKRDYYLRDKSKIQSISIDLSVKVPEKIKLDIDNKFGDIYVSNMSNKTIVKNGYGDINLEIIDGDIELENSFGEVEVSQITGNTIIENKNGKIFGEDIKGNVEIENAFGDIDIDTIVGNVNLENKNGKINVYEVEGEIVVKNKFGDIEVKEAYNAIDIKNKNGRVYFKTSKKVNKYLSIDNEFGEISVELPKDQEGYFDVYTKFGNIKSEFNNLNINSDMNEESISNSLGDSEVEINLSTKNGSIEIEKR